MNGYRLWVEDSKGRSANVVRPDHSRNGVACFSISDDMEFTIVLEHSSGCVTYFVVDKEGDIIIEQS